MKLIPLSDDGDEIVFPKFLKKCRIGRAEIKNALVRESKEKAEKVSKSAVDFEIQNDAVSVTNIGKNCIFTGCFGMPLQKLVPDEKRALSFGDVIGFRPDALVFRIEEGSNRKVDKPEIADNVENEDQGTLSDNAEWTSGSSSDHQKLACRSNLFKELLSVKILQIMQVVRIYQDLRGEENHASMGEAVIAKIRPIKLNFPTLVMMIGGIL